MKGINLSLFAPHPARDAPPPPPPSTCLASLVNDEEKRVLLLTNAVSWVALLSLLCVWQWNKRRKLRRRQRRQSRSQSVTSCSSSSDLEQECLVLALQEELQAKSIAENEQAILWRQEKRILQSRIDKLLSGQQQESKPDDESKQLHEAQLLQQVKDMQETISFLTSLTESQTEELESKQQEIAKLHNIVEEMQQHMGVEAQVNVNVKGSSSFETHEPTTDEDDYDADLSIDSSVDDEGCCFLEEEEKDEPDKCRLQGGNKVVLLVSTMPGNLSTSMHQSRLETIFRQGLNLGNRYLEVVDGCDAELTSLRNDLFEISGLRAVYPQVFLVEEGEISFVGDFDTVQDLHDGRELPQRIGLMLPEKESNTPVSRNNKYENLGSMLLDTNVNTTTVGGMGYPETAEI